MKIKIKRFTVLMIFCSAISCFGQTDECMKAYSPSARVMVWPKGMPEENGIKIKESVENCFMVRNTTKAEMFVYFPKEIKSHSAVLICPGGGYLGIAMWVEGHDIAQKFNEIGITAIVLKYRLPNFHPLVPFSDATQAIRLIRFHAKEWNIDPHKIGIAGFSAGGHIASFMGTHFDEKQKRYAGKLSEINSRPDFMILFYPVITMQDFTHLGSRYYLLGDNPSQLQKDYYSNEKHVTCSTPPAFIVVSEDDQTVDPQNSYQFNAALQRNNVPVELNVFKQGEHGFGSSKLNLPVDNWPNLLKDWLKRRKFIE